MEINRLNQLRELINKKDIDAVLLSSRSNTYYFTGFTGTTSKFLLTTDKAYIIVDFRYTVQAEGQVYKGIEVIEYEKGAQDTLSDLCSTHGVEVLGIEGDDVSFAEYKTLQEKLCTAKSILDIQHEINQIRVIKDDDEIAFIQKAVDIADRAFEEILPYIKPGVKEYEIAVELEYKMKKMGAAGASFETIVASGPRSALPHGVAGMRELQKGDPVVMDFGAIYKGYCSDLTRTVFLGNPQQKLKEIYNIVLDAQLNALDKASCGITGKELDKISRDIIYGAGFKKCFGHGLGHGVGVEIHEMPRISPKGYETLKKGMVFTIEPGIYIKNTGGVRIEDMVFLTENGARVLTKSAKEMIVL